MFQVDKTVLEINNLINKATIDRDFLIKNKEILEGCPFGIVPTGTPRLVITKLSDLTEARKILRKLFGSWKDEYHHSFYATGVAISTWIDDRHPWQLWMECPIEEFPKELLPSDSCQWVETTSKDYNLVCPR